MKAKRTEVPKLYTVEHQGRTFWIDGYSGEWKLSEGESVTFSSWWETYPTKADALADINRIITIK